MDGSSIPSLSVVNQRGGGGRKAGMYVVYEWMERGESGST